MELLDIYDDNGEKTGKIVERGTSYSNFNKGEHIGVAIIYIENSKGEFLIQKTSKEKGGHYSSTGGHINHGEEPIDTIIREVKEELGLDVNKEEITDLGYLLFDFPIRFIFYLKKDIDINDLTIQKEEVESVSFMNKDELKDIINKGLMHKAHSKILEMILDKKKDDFDTEINYLENYEFDSDYIIKKGNIPILFTAPHTMNQLKEDGTIKISEPYTKAIALYMNKHCNASCMIKLKDTGEDSNRDNRDKFKTELIRFVKENNIKIVIDLHGSKRDREFDIEFGTLNNLSTDYSTIKELEEAFIENGIKNIVYNDPFKGGAITEYLYSINDIDAIQVEINYKYRDYNNTYYLEKLIKSFENFIKQYKRYM